MDGIGRGMDITFIPGKHREITFDPSNLTSKMEERAAGIADEIASEYDNVKDYMVQHDNTPIDKNMERGYVEMSRNVNHGDPEHDVHIEEYMQFNPENPEGVVYLKYQDQNLADPHKKCTIIYEPAENPSEPDVITQLKQQGSKVESDDVFYNANGTITLREYCGTATNGVAG